MGVTNMTRKFRSSDTVRHREILPRELSLRYVPVVTLQSDPNNPRVHTDRQIDQIARSIKTFGFNVPILVDLDLNVIAGHGRLLAAKLLHIDQVPVIKLELSFSKIPSACDFNRIRRCVPQANCDS